MIESRYIIRIPPELLLKLSLWSWQTHFLAVCKLKPSMDSDEISASVIDDVQTITCTSYTSQVPTFIQGTWEDVYRRCRGPSSPMVALQIGRVYHILTSWEKLKLHEIEEFEFFLLEVGLLSPYQLDGYLSKRAFGLSFRWLVAVRLLCLFRCQLSCWVDY